MNKKLIRALLVAVLFLSSIPRANAQMMGYPSPSPLTVDNPSIQVKQQEEQEGKILLDKLNNRKITCQKLTDQDFEKIGEYFMGKAIGDTLQHISMNNMMKTMMGENGEEQLHIAWGKRGSNCEGNVSESLGLSGFIISLIWAVSLVDLVLLGILLWKKIKRF